MSTSLRAQSVPLLSSGLPVPALQSSPPPLPSLFHCISFSFAVLCILCISLLSSFCLFSPTRLSAPQLCPALWAINAF